MTLVNQITYQVGVDVLGFPIYVQHKIYEGVETVQTRSKFHKNRKLLAKRFRCITEKIFKQH